MSTIAEKFENFWNTLSECQYELPEEIKPILLESLKSSGLLNQTSTTSENTEPKLKKLSGYNVFLKDKMVDLKEQNIPAGERMSKIGGLWKELGEEEKSVWNKKASDSRPQNVNSTTTKSTQTKKINGYQLYVRETMADVKANTDIPATGRLKEIARKWKTLTNEEQNEFKNKAKNIE